MFDSMELVTIKKLAGKVTQPIDPEFLPPGYGGGGVSSWNDLTDKPFGSEVKRGVALNIESKRINGDGFVLLDYPVSIFAGEQYAVHFNGNDFNCTAVSMDDPGTGISAILLGNIGAMMGEEGTGETFLLMVLDGMTHIMPLDGGNWVLSMTITGLTEIVTPIDEKYLPKDDIAGVLYVDYTPSGTTEGNDVMYLNCPAWSYEEIEDVVLAGKHRVVARCEITDGYIAHLPFSALYNHALQFTAFHDSGNYLYMLVIEHRSLSGGDETMKLTTRKINLT